MNGGGGYVLAAQTTLSSIVELKGCLGTFAKVKNMYYSLCVSDPVYCWNSYLQILWLVGWKKVFSTIFFMVLAVLNKREIYIS